MLRRSFVPLCLTAFAVVPRAALAQRGSDSGADTLKIAQGIEHQWISNYDSGNAGAIAQMFAPDGSFYTAAGTVLVGPDEIASALTARMKAGWTRQTVDIMEAHATGSTMWIFGQYMLVGSGAYDGKQISGHYMKGLSQYGPDWRIRTLVSNTTQLGIVTPASPR